MIEVKIGNSFELIKTLKDKSIDCIITSPPYFGLRDYKTKPIIFDGIKDCEHDWIEHVQKPKGGMPTETTTVGANKNGEANNRGHDTVTNFCSKCGAWKGQLGLEPTPELYLNHLVSLFDDIKLKLKDEGNCFVNLGDSYSNSGGSGNNPDNHKQFGKIINNGTAQKPKRIKSLPSKCLCMIPQRFAWMMVEHGWILRNEIVWYKRNHMPSSVKDRWANAHEKIYFFTKQQKNYFNLDAIRKPLSESSMKRILQSNIMNQTGGVKQEELRGNPENGNASRCNKMVQSLAKKYKGKFDDIDNPEMFNSPRARTQRDKYSNSGSRTSEGLHEGRWNDYLHPNGKNPGDVYNVDEKYILEDVISAWKEIHPEDWNTPKDVFDVTTRPYKEAHFATFPIDLVKDPILAGCPENGIVLDPFGGSGTVGEFCKNNNRNAILFELNPEYKVLIDKRVEIKPKTKSLFDF